MVTWSQCGDVTIEQIRRNRGISFTKFYKENLMPQWCRGSCHVEEYVQPYFKSFICLKIQPFPWFLFVRCRLTVYFQLSSLIPNHCHSGPSTIVAVDPRHCSRSSTSRLSTLDYFSRLSTIFLDPRPPVTTALDPRLFFSTLE